jgi:hypothetical protein
MRRGLHRGGDPKVVLPLQADLAVQRHQIDGVAGEMPGVHGPAGAARDQRGLALTRAQACLGPEVLSRDLEHALDHPNQVGVHALQRHEIDGVTKGHSTLPHEEGDHAGAGRGGVAGGALPKSAGSSFHGRRKPNGSACQRRTMAGVQDEAKHAIRAMSPLKSCDVEKPQPQR